MDDKNMDDKTWMTKRGWQNMDDKHVWKNMDDKNLDDKNMDTLFAEHL